METLNTVNGIATVRHTLSGVIQFRCVECDRWVASQDQRIKHSKSCESQAQPVAEIATAKAERFPVAAVKNGAVSAVLTEDEIVKAVREKKMTVSDAMNRDF